MGAASRETSQPHGSSGWRKPDWWRRRSPDGPAGADPAQAVRRSSTGQRRPPRRRFGTGPSTNGSFCSCSTNFPDDTVHNGCGKPVSVGSVLWPASGTRARARTPSDTRAASPRRLDPTYPFSSGTTTHRPRHGELSGALPRPRAARGGRTRSRNVGGSRRVEYRRAYGEGLVYDPGLPRTRSPCTVRISLA